MNIRKIAALLFLVGLLSAPSRPAAGEKEKPSPENVEKTVFLLVDRSAYPRLRNGIEEYTRLVSKIHPVTFRVLKDAFYAMKPPAIRARLKKAWAVADPPASGAIMVGPIPCAMGGDPKTLVYPCPLYYEDFDAQWIDENGDGVFERIETNREQNGTELWTAWWVPPSNDPVEQEKLLEGFLDKLVRYHRGEIRGRDGAIFIAGNGNSVEITESWTVLLDDTLRTAGQKVTRVYSRDGQMKEAVPPDPGPDFTARDFMRFLSERAWQHVHTLTHGSPEGFYWHNGDKAVAVTTETLDLGLFHGTGPVIFTTSGCSNGVFRGTLKPEADYAKSMANVLLFSPRTCTVAFYGSASPQSSSVFAGFHTELIEALRADRPGYLAQGYFRFRNRDYAWGLQHHIFRGVDGKVLNGDPFARYVR